MLVKLDHLPRDRGENNKHLKPPPSKLLVGLSPCPVTVTTRVVMFLVGDPYKPSFATVTGTGDNPNYRFMPLQSFSPESTAQTLDLRLFGAW